MVSPIGGRVGAAEKSPYDLRCEWKSYPLNVEREAPRLSWKSLVKSQVAYQIQVASCREQLEVGKPDRWDSGRVLSPVSVAIAYQGKVLGSRDECYWRVRVWGEGEPDPGPWNTDGRWEMGLLQDDDWQAGWIRSPAMLPAKESPELTRWINLAGMTIDKSGKKQDAGARGLREKLPATWFRKRFEISKPLGKARLYSTAAGYIEVFLDGHKVSRRVMNPAQTDFEKRILYDVDAVEDRLAPGDHTISAHLGEGFYGEGFGLLARHRYGDPALLMQLELTYADGSREIISTDESWQCHASPVLKNYVYAGEYYDARLEVSEDAKAWRPVQVEAKSPTGRLEAQLIPPVTMVREVMPRKIFTPKPGTYVFDFGQNFTGVPTLRLKEHLPAGTAVCLRYSEWADEHGNIHQDSDGSFATRVHQVDAYVTKGAAMETWSPSFAWHGFRYIEVTGLPYQPGLDLLTAHLVRSGIVERGRFRSSDPHLNRVHETALWTYESNLVSLPMDCPVRERCGWTGDAHATVSASHANFEMPNFWEKYLGDFRTSRHISPAIVPGKRGGNSNPDWAVGQVLIAWEHYLNYGDTQVLKEHYPGLKAFMEYFASKRKDGVIEIGYGDWCDPVRAPGIERVGGRGTPQQTKPAVTSSGLFVYACDLMAQVADILGNGGDAQHFRQRCNEAKAAFHRRFFDSGTSSYGSQTADSMALSFGIVPQPLRQAVENALNRDVLGNWKGHASVGALGHRWLYPALGDAGHADTAYGTFHAEGHPGFHYLFDGLNGTSLWERKGAFDPKTMKAPQRSLSHPFQGGYDAWFYQGLGGIRPDPERPAHKHFFLKPCFPAGLDWVEVDLNTPYGLVQSHWKRVSGKVQWSVLVPPNTTATVYVPAATTDDIAVNGKPVHLADHATVKGEEAGRTVLELAPGNYVITSRP